jgi:hypothetical protein
MAFNSQIKGYMTFGKSFSRGGAFPLEAYEIWTDYDALVAYAANTDPAKDPSYIGQKVAYVDIANNKVTHYGIEIDGTLKEIGAATNGDGFTIDLVNGVLSLHGINDATTVAGMLPQVDVVDGKKGIKWVPISEVVQGDGNKVTTLTSSDGSVVITATTDTDSSLVYDLKVEHPAVPVYAITSERNADDNATIYHLTKDGENVAQEIIVPDAYDDTALTARVKTLEDAGYQTANDVNTAITSGITGKADKADTLAGYGIADAYTKDEVDTELAKKAAKTDLEALQARVEAFLDNTGAATDAIDTLQELLEYIDAHGAVELAADIEALEKKVVLGTDAEGKEYTTVKAYVEAAIEAIKIGDYAKAADLTALAGRVEALEGKPFDTYATKSEVETVDAKFVNKLDVATYNTEKATFAVAETVNADLAKKVDKETYEADKATFAVKTEVAATYVTKEELAPVTTTANNAAAKVTNLEEKIKEITEVGGEPNSIEYIKVNGAIQTPDEEKAVNITVPTALADLSGYTELNALAQKGVDDAKTANDAIATLAGAGGRIAGIEADVANLKTTTSGHGTTIGDHETRVAAIEATIADGGSVDLRFDALEGFQVSQAQVNKDLNDAIATKLATDAFNTTIADYYKKSEADALLGNKADKATTYTKDEVNGLLANLDQSEIKANIQANASAIAALIGSVEGDDKKSVRNIAKEEVAAIVGAAPEALDTLEEIATWIGTDTTGAAAMASDIAGLKTKVDTGDKTVSEYVDDAIAAIVQPKASEEVTVAEDGTLGIGEVSTDKLVQGTDTLVLCGGDATK